MKRNQIYTGIIVFVCCVLVAIGVTLRLLKHADKLPVKVPVLVNRQKPQVADTLKKKPVAKPDFRISGTLKDTEGRGVAGVIVSDGFNCVKTDSHGRYKMKRDSLARFIYYSVPADCEVPTHSATDRTAYFYQTVSKKKKIYNFTLRSIMAATTPSWSVRYARHWGLLRCASSPLSAITTRMAKLSTAANGKRISVLPIFPSIVAMCITSVSTTAFSIVEWPIIRRANCVNAR